MATNLRDLRTIIIQVWLSAKTIDANCAVCANESHEFHFRRTKALSEIVHEKKMKILIARAQRTNRTPNNRQFVARETMAR